MFKLILLFTALTLYAPTKIFAIEKPLVIINEICWMGSTQSSSDEWIELYNPTLKSISIDDWVLKTQDENIKIILKGTIPSQGFFLLERTDDNSVPSEKADLIYQGALNNSGENLILLDNNSTIIDQAEFLAKWLFGNNKTKQTMERINSVRHVSDISLTLWCTSETTGGTPKQLNSQCPKNQPLTITPEPTSTPKTIFTPQPTKSDAIRSDRSILQQVKNVFINEVLPSPEGPDTENEFIELFNANNFEVNLLGWKIKDKLGSTKSYSIPENTKIEANGFLVLRSSQTKISLNNSGDGIELINSSGKILDSTDFGKAKQGQSWSRIENTWQWTSQATPDQENIATPSQAPTSTNFTSATTSSPNPLTANIQSYPPKHKNLIAVGIAVVIALASAVIAWFIKKKSTEI